jgi:hypothetical protein
MGSEMDYIFKLQINDEEPEFTAIHYYLANGTEAWPYKIDSRVDLQELGMFASYNTAHHYRLINDINLEGLEWTPIGNSTAACFSGTFDGDNHTIYNLKIETKGDIKGLIGCTTGVTVIKNIRVNGSIDTTGIAGLVVGRVPSGDASFENVHVNGSITGGSGGGILGNSNSSVLAKFESCSADVNINVRGDAGGLLNGYAFQIDNCSSSGTVRGESRAGGLAGEFNSTSGYIKNSYSTADVSGNYGAGGLLGYVNNSVTKLNNIITDSYATGSVSAAEAAAGGIVGQLNSVRGTYPYTLPPYILGEKLLALNKSVSVDKYIISGNGYVPVYTAGRIFGYTQIRYNSNVGHSMNPGMYDAYAYSGTLVNGETVSNSEADLEALPIPPTLPPSTSMSEVYYYTFDGADYFGDINSLVSTLGWDPDVWDLDTDSREYKLPILKSLIGTPNQDNLTTPEHLVTAPLI